MPPRPGYGRASTQHAGRWGSSVFLVLLLAFTKLIQPTYGVTGIQGLAISVLPLALAAVGQAIVVISGGIDLSIGSMMALTSVVAASQMKGQSEEFGVAVVLGVLVLGLVLGAINGSLIVADPRPGHRGHARDVVRLGGYRAPRAEVAGGGAAVWLKELDQGIAGQRVGPARPRSCCSSSSRSSGSRSAGRGSACRIYAIGSNRLAAFRSGVSVGRTKIVAYALTGLFAALGGLSLTASTGIGTPVPGPYTC